MPTKWSGIKEIKAPKKRPIRPPFVQTFLITTPLKRGSQKKIPPPTPITVAIESIK
jgi:hypothetical protein